jgi:hypothetical protein
MGEAPIKKDPQQSKLPQKEVKLRCKPLGIHPIDFETCTILVNSLIRKLD